eukprot:2463225-Rhodomonas_salina.1
MTCAMSTKVSSTTMKITCDQAQHATASAREHARERHAAVKASRRRDVIELSAQTLLGRNAGASGEGGD